MRGKEMLSRKSGDEGDWRRARAVFPAKTRRRKDSLAAPSGRRGEIFRQNLLVAFEVAAKRAFPENGPLAGTSLTDACPLARAASPLHVVQPDLDAGAAAARPLAVAAGVER